ncbi:MAG: T9SS type A sorting domain-containing protein [Prolixibacteraceae bacterium]|jgi:hypothetical protein
MKKLLLLFFLVVGWSVLSDAQTKQPYNNLIITEAQFNRPEFCYVEFTNKGTETINLKNFEFGQVGAWTVPWAPTSANAAFMLPDKELAPGESYVIAAGSDWEPMMWLKNPNKYRERVTKPEMYKLADQILHRTEAPSATKLDSVTPGWQALENWNGRDCLYLRHHYLDVDGVTKDSMIIDQVNGMFTTTGGTRDISVSDAVDVAGVTNATANSILIRKNSVVTGIQEFSSMEDNAAAAKLQFSNNKGLDLGDSEWIPVPIPGGENSFGFEPWRAVFWTVGNSVNATLDASTLVSKTGKVQVDFANGKITVPWGIRNNDSIMYQFERKSGLAWKYDLAPTTEDSAYISARTGDKLTVYACGDVAAIKEFTINVLPPTADDNIVVPKNGFNYTRMFFTVNLGPYSGFRVTDGVPGMDTIKFIDYATRVDTLFKYLEKAPKASWEIVFKSGVVQPDLKLGDILRVTSESGKVKDYFLKLDEFVPSSNAYLGAITWPDMPAFFKGSVAKSYGWKGDTIPGFVNSKFDYVVNIPLGYDGIPALIFYKEQTDSRVTVSRAKTLDGSTEDRTAKFTVTAENDTIINVYTVRFEREKDNSNVQPWKGEPFISQYSWNDQWARNWVEIANPGTEPLDLSHYMITCGQVDYSIFNNWNTVDDWEEEAYHKYVPGKKWQSQADWQVTPRLLEPDLAVSSFVYPGDVFVMADHGGGGSWDYYGQEADVNFATGKNPWGYNMPWGNAVTGWWGATYLYKILNDSVVNGLKPATDPNDFELIDVIGQPDNTNWVVGGVTQGQLVGYTRKPNIYKGNPVLKASFGTNQDDCEWIARDRAYYDALGIGWPLDIYKINDGLGSLDMDPVTIYKSTIASTVYKVSEGYSKKETIKGITTGTTVGGFYANVLKLNELQTLTVKSASSGLELGEAAALAKGDTLVVMSADSTNISKYILDVSTSGLSDDAVLTSTAYTIDITGSTGTISGFKQGTLLKNIVSGVMVPTGAMMTMIDQKDAYISLSKLNYDTAYVNVVATDNIYFEVVAENNTTKILYQLKPTSNPSDAYVTSDVYSVDQFASLIKFVPGGTTVPALLNNLTPAPGATMKVYDKAGFERTTGDIYRDDKLVVTSSDGTATKAYYFSMLNFNVNKYLAFVISDDYIIDQVAFTISGPMSSTTLGEFYNKLYPSFGATLSVLDKDGNVSTAADLSVGDQLLVTAADGMTTAMYSIDVNNTKAIDPVSESIKMYPNPTTGRVIINGLTKGNRVQVFNSVGVTLRDVIVDNSTEYVSLSAQPAGMYMFVISSGEKHINIQKIIKK